MPPVLDPEQSKVDGLAFLGLSLSRKSKQGHPDSVTHQESFDFNEILDRSYDYIFSTNDDGWLVGGGEPGPPISYKLAAKDSAHVELIRIGTYHKEWGGVPLVDLLDLMMSGDILIPQIEVVPTAVVANSDVPPELEIRFDMEPSTMMMNDADDSSDSLPINWQLRFVHNQLFQKLKYPSRFCPGPFHSTIVRKAEFRSKQHEQDYFDKCNKVIQKWRKIGPQPLNTIRRTGTGQEQQAIIDDENENENDDENNNNENNNNKEYNSGIWLFTDRNNITHFFKPNFFPPYDTPEKKDIIWNILKEEWDETTLSWKPAAGSS
eukprot:scaffold1427_cov63-Cylindrotheca_fusiformis.AAC.3